MEGYEPEFFFSAAELNEKRGALSMSMAHPAATEAPGPETLVVKRATSARNTQPAAVTGSLARAANTPSNQVQRLIFMEFDEKEASFPHYPSHL